MNFRYLYISLIVFCLSVGIMQSQTNTFYFMDGIPTRTDMNPAFMPDCNGYLDFIILPSFYIGLGNNSLKMSDGLYMQNGRLVTALSPGQNADNLFSKLRPVTALELGLNLKLLNFGFRTKSNGYFTFDFSLKSNGGIFLPKDLFRLALYGTENEFSNNTFDLKRLGADIAIYNEIGLGYMHPIGDKWTLGGRLKFLMGYASIYSDIRSLRLEASREQWHGVADASIYGAMPIEFQYNENGNIDLSSGKLKYNNWQDYIKPSGYGAGIDLGLTFKPIENLTLSAAVTDLSFIRWTKNIYQGSIKGDTVFTGINYHYGDTIDFNKMGQDFIDAFGVKATQGNTAYTQMLMANFNFGVEYGILDNKISFGALSHTKFNNRQVFEDITLAANFRPADWFKTYFSYSFLNNRYNSFGFGVNLRMGAVNTFIVADYIPLHWANIKSNGNTYPAPYKAAMVNLQAGLSFKFGYKKDKDRDGIKDKYDMCPDTDIDMLKKLCPDVKRKEFVDNDGCEFDSDKDGVHDCYDICPNTPIGIQVDDKGCPIDSDGDGVTDDKDQCPETPTVAEVDENGCPKDSDKDGIADYLDKCSNTPKGITVDENGCPVDSDGDGVTDDKDQCPKTPTAAEVDENGCPKDSDKDGVADYLDKCPNTPQEAWGKIDENGCPKDSDGDGVEDYKDRCPEVAGVASNDGCPELKEEVKRLFKQALQGIQFETGKATIKPISYPILNNVATVMEENPDFLLNIAGHTDNQGSDELNQKLSEERAAAVKAYLASKGVAEERMTSEGFGESKPVADNKTAAGRKVNRRVEFTVSFLR